MVKRANKKKTTPPPRGAIAKPPRLKAAVDMSRGADVSMDTAAEEGGAKKKRAKNAKVKRSLVRKKRRVKVMGAKHKQRRKGIN
ncbi:hypothetical protein AB1Y20_014458 [Prymnesium parvum]|uniref:Mitochondrial mRNA-processing protein COX24 C-terminal domain-containing protein n=1 Tax=Prymnesium parvum TaxID=97485 RepID=A0AB34IDS4_PRYPA|mmetsp:Transcript_39447/g.97801  ORF Transcript_39447/g.97801 Transcript_39447/m.97801 type:complete len:84 (+) Transcript_39447:45-296(+)